jgi:hypothetical protein
MRDRLTDPMLLLEFRRRILRAQAARLMIALDEAGLHEAAAHISTGIEAIDRTAGLRTGPGVERLH